MTQDYSGQTGESLGSDFPTVWMQTRASQLTKHSGTARPDYAQPGTCWYNTGNGIINFYDGNIDIPLYRIDSSNHVLNAPIGGGSISLSSAATVDLGSSPESNITITGTTSITSFGSSVPVGQAKFVSFSGTLTLTHNGTSLILPGGVNITTAAGDTAMFVSLGGGNWRCISYTPASGLIRTIKRQLITSSGLYIPSPGMVCCDVKIAGGGGAGGSGAATSGSTNTVAGGGGAGAVARKLFTASEIGASQTVTIGAAGTPSAAGNNAGGDGGDSSFGSLLTATGGKGGGAGETGTVTQYSPAGLGGTASGGDVNISGGNGTPGMMYSISLIMAGIGGGNAICPPTGIHTGGAFPGNVLAGTGPGGGGQGAWLITSQSASQGGTGRAGVAIITEYCVV